jgi:AcrR family transcriptional regulator
VTTTVARYQAGIETRRRILGATRELLGDVGLEGTTLKAICDRADVGAGSFYNLFESKEEAVLSVVAEAIAAVDPAEHRSGDVDETVGDLVDTYLKFVTGEPDLARIYLQAAVAWGLNDPALAHRFRRHQQRRVERLEAALGRERASMPARERRSRAEFLLASLNGVAMTWLLDPDTDLEAHRTRLLGEV